MLQKNKKNASVTLTLKHPFQIQKEHASKKVEKNSATCSLTRSKME